MVILSTSNGMGLDDDQERDQMRKAPTGSVDKAILAAAENRDAICIRMAAGETCLIAELTKATSELALQKFNRDQIIRKFFGDRS